MYDSDGAYVNYNQMNLKEGWNRWEKPGDIVPTPRRNMAIRANPARDLPVIWRTLATYAYVA